jgi:hypothetical protein
VSESADIEAEDKKKEILKQLNCLTDVRQYRLNKVENIYTRAKSDLSKKQTALEDTRQKTAAFEAQSKNQIADMKNDKMSRGIDPSQLLGWINKEAQIMTTIEKKNNQLVADQYAVNDFQEVVKEHKLAYQKAMRKLEKIECLKQIMTEE